MFIKTKALKIVIFYAFLVFLTPFSMATSLSVNVYEKAENQKKVIENVSEVFLEDHFSNESVFNYYGEESLIPYQSLFLDGVDQRFLELNYNGFGLRDPSHPSGVFNVSALLASTGNRVISNKGVKLEINNDPAEKTYVEIGLTQLGEVKTSFQKNLCESDFCYTAGAFLQRGGGFSQKDGGVEKDYFKRMDLNYSSVKYKSSYEDQTYILYSGQDYDVDTVDVNSPNFESLGASSKSSVFFLGKKYKFKDFLLNASYLGSYRSQKNPEAPSKFAQRGEVFEVGGDYKKVSFKLFKENYDFFTVSDSDFGGVASFSNFFKGGSYSLEGGGTKLRKEFGSFNLGYKNVGFFAKAVQASLAQSSLNDRNGKEELKTQNIFGVRYKNAFFKKSKVKLSLRMTYSRIFNFIDYDFISQSYNNLDEVENGLLKLEASYLNFDLFGQYQKSENLSTGKTLVQRPFWTFGLRGLKKFKSAFILKGLVKVVGDRRAFDQSLLDPFWQTEVSLKYKSFSLIVANALDERKAVYKGLGRRPLTAELKYQKTF